MKGTGPLIIIAIIIGIFLIALAFANLNVGLLTTIGAAQVSGGAFAGEDYSFPNNLTIGGDLIGNSIIGTFVYGSMGNSSDAGIEVNVSVIDVYEDVIMLENDGVSTLTFNEAEGSLNSFINGEYRVDYSISFSDGPNSLYSFVIGINGIPQNETLSQRKVQASGDVGNTGGTGVITVVSGDQVTMMIRDDEAPVQGILIHAINVNVMRLGD